MIQTSGGAPNITAVLMVSFNISAMILECEGPMNGTTLTTGAGWVPGLSC